MATVNRKVFETVDNDGNKIFLAVVRPRPDTEVDARRLYSKTKTRLLNNKEAIPRSRARDLATELGLWSDEKQAQLDTFEKEIARLEDIVHKGRKADLTEEDKSYIDEHGMKLFGRHVALNLRRVRFERILLLLETSQLNDIIAEEIAENEMIDFFVSQVTVWGKNEGKDSLYNKSYFDKYSDFISKKNEPAARKAREEFLNLFNENDPDWEKKLPENKLLLKYGFVNDSLKLVNDKGEFVDVDWNRVDEEGNSLDENGNPIKSETDSVEEVVADFDDVVPTASVTPSEPSKSVESVVVAE